MSRYRLRFLWQTKEGWVTGERFCDEPHSDDTKDERSITATSQYE